MSSGKKVLLDVFKNQSKCSAYSVVLYPKNRVTIHSNVNTEHLTALSVLLCFCDIL